MGCVVRSKIGPTLAWVAAMETAVVPVDSMRRPLSPQHPPGHK
jgi:hypothetical protein